MMNGIQFQSVQTPNTLSSELRSVIRDNVLQFYVPLSYYHKLLDCFLKITLSNQNL